MSIDKGLIEYANALKAQWTTSSSGKGDIPELPMNEAGQITGKQIVFTENGPEARDVDDPK